MIDQLIEAIQNIFTSGDDLASLAGADADRTMDSLLDALESQGIDLSAFSPTDIQEALREAFEQSADQTSANPASHVSFAGQPHTSATDGFQDEQGQWHWRGADGSLNDGNIPPSEKVSGGLGSTHAHHHNVSFSGYTNADGTYHYTSDNTDRDPETGAIIRRY